jgi:hypothetical protein
MRGVVSTLKAGRAFHSRSVSRVGVVLAAAMFAAVQFAVSCPGAAFADPFVEQTVLLGHGNGFGGAGGVGDHSVALSADGNTVLVGAPNGSSGEPSYALIFTRSGSTWSQPVSLVPEVEPGVERSPQSGFGESVAVSADGSAAIVGGARNTAFVFTKVGATWASTRIEPPRETACSERFGQAVAMSEDGNTVIVGDPFGCPEDFDGSAWIYSRSGHEWTLQAGPLHGEEKINPFGNDDNFASTVALSGDGNTAIIGADGEDGGLSAAFGAAWVYKRSGSTWRQDGPKLDPPDKQAGANFGRSVALSGSGSRALIGTGAEKNEGSGAWIFDRGPGGWTAQARLASGEDTSFNGSFGWTVALSRSGDTALVGGPETHPQEEGQAWAFGCGPNGWIRETVGPPVTTKEGNFGYSVALGADGATALASSPGVESRKGAVFVLSGPSDSAGSCSGTPSAMPGGSGSQGGVPAAPVVESLRQTHQLWREGRAVARLAGSHAGAPVGTTFGFSLSVPARLHFRFAQTEKGVMVHGRCVPSSHRGHARRCVLRVGRGTLTLSAGAGPRHLLFEGRLSKRDRLRPGAYTVTLIAEAAGKRSAPRHLSFKIVG